jgi:hypothetical protein
MRKKERGEKEKTYVSKKEKKRNKKEGKERKTERGSNTTERKKERNKDENLSTSNFALFSRISPLVPIVQEFFIG